MLKSINASIGVNVLLEKQLKTKTGKDYFKYSVMDNNKIFDIYSYKQLEINKNIILDIRITEFNGGLVLWSRE